VRRKEISNDGNKGKQEREEKTNSRKYYLVTCTINTVPFKIHTDTNTTRVLSSA